MVSCLDDYANNTTVIKCNVLWPILKYLTARTNKFPVSPIHVQGAAEITPTFGGVTARAVEGVQ